MLIMMKETFAYVIIKSGVRESLVFLNENFEKTVSNCESLLALKNQLGAAFFFFFLTASLKTSLRSFTFRRDWKMNTPVLHSQPTKTINAYNLI